MAILSTNSILLDHDGTGQLSGLRDRGLLVHRVYRTHSTRVPPRLRDVEPALTCSFRPKLEFVYLSTRILLGPWGRVNVAVEGLVR